MRRVLAVVLALIAVAVLAQGEQEPEVEVPVFPNFAFTSVDGSHQIDLHSLHGRPVLMTFWASWCGPCRMELPELEKLSEELADEDFALVTVNTDQSPAMGLRFLKRYDIEVPVYRMDPRSLVTLGVDSLPTNVLLDREGRPVGIYRGYSPELPDEIRRLVRAMDDAPDGGDDAGRQ
jgi:thiol-disulfide isomerase/thioredoxin